MVYQMTMFHTEIWYKKVHRTLQKKYTEHLIFQVSASSLTKKSILLFLFQNF